MLTLLPLGADLSVVRALAVAVVYLGLPGLLVGLAAGILIRRWLVLLGVALAAGVAVRYGVDRIDRSPTEDDDDPGVILIVALVANFIAFVVGATAGRLLASRRA